MNPQNPINTLLLLTKYYPYGTGEAFLENEIAVLSASFERVVLIACEAPLREGYVRPVPGNVTVCAVPGKRGILGFIRDLLGGFPRLFSKSDMLKSEWPLAKGLRQKVFLTYFEGKSSRIFRAILKKDCLKNLGKEKFILYSYWFFSPARVGGMIMEHLESQVAYSVVRAHRYDLYEEQNPLGYLPARKYLLNRYDAVFTCSVDGARYLSEKYPAYAFKVRPSLLGTLDHGLAKASGDRHFRMVSCSRAVKSKRVERIASALALIELRGKVDAGAIVWTHIGDGPELKRIKKSAGRLKKCAAVFAGNLENKEVLSFYQNNPVDLFVNVSSSEGLPVSVMEAVSFGIPVLAANVGGMSEIVCDGASGYLLDADFSDDELADYIELVIRAKDTSEYRVLRESARSVWETHFEAGKNYGDFCGRIISEAAAALR